jgi:hypothetical protein
MGLNIRPTSGRIANGSKLIVAGQPTTGIKVFPVTFTKKSNPYNSLPNANEQMQQLSGSTSA